MKLFSFAAFLALSLTLSLATAPALVAHADGSGAGGTVSDADVKRWLAFWDKLVDTVVADKDACPKMGTDLNAVIDANKDLLDQAEKAKTSGKQLPADAAQHMKDTAPKLIGPIMNCKNDAGVKTAIQRLKLGGQQGH